MNILNRLKHMKQYQSIALVVGVIAMILVFLIAILNRTHLMHIPGSSLLFRGSRLIMLVSFAIYIFEESKVLCILLVVISLMFFIL